ncbi:MAG: AmmeMemoRadiSam system protein B [bacterium]
MKTNLIIVCCATMVAVSCAQEPAPETGGRVIRSPIAGSWYPGDPEVLRRDLASYLDGAEDAALPGVCALIVPHAGYRYSGGVAGFAYRQLKGRSFSRVVVLGPSHSVAMRNIVSIPSAAFYETPLGRVAIDVAFVAKLRASAAFKDIPAASTGEHSVEIQIPFIQQVLPGTPIVPVTVGQLDAEGVRAIAATLRGALDERTLVIASSDFTHYGPNYDFVPFTEDVENNLRTLDLGAIAQIEKKDAGGLQAYCDRTGATVCGRDPISVLLAMLPEGAKAHLLKYDTSGRMTGDFQNSVSYMAAAFEGAWEAPAAQASLDEEDRAALLKLARGTLDYYFAHGRLPEPSDLGLAIRPGMEQVMGAFVTLTKNHDLRGCIGEIRPRRPVYQAVIEHAVDAAVNDSRFKPVTKEECAGLSIEISALLPPHAIDSYRDIVIGRDGIVLYKGGASAVFLPQVATEQGWGVEETLSHLAAKAGLPPGAWKEGTRFEVFQAIVFGENER